METIWTFYCQVPKYQSPINYIITINDPHYMWNIDSKYNLFKLFFCLFYCFTNGADNSGEPPKKSCGC